jgi:hypothetical protein
MTFKGVSMNLFERVFPKSIGSEVERRVKLILTDRDGFYEQHSQGSGIDQRDRYDYDREEILRLVLEAWRTNPIARRLVELLLNMWSAGVCKLAASTKVQTLFCKSGGSIR